MAEEQLVSTADSLVRCKGEQPTAATESQSGQHVLLCFFFYDAFLDANLQFLF